MKPKLKLKAEPIVVCRPKTLLKVLNWLSIIIFVVVDGAFLGLLIDVKFIPILAVPYFLMALFSIFRFISHYPVAVYVMPDSLIFERRGGYEQLYWHEIDFIKEKSLYNRRLIVGSQLFAKWRALQGLLTMRRWHPVYVIDRSVLSNYDEAATILKKHLKHKLI